MGNMEVDCKYFLQECIEWPASESAARYHRVCLNNEHVNKHYLFTTVWLLAFWIVQHHWKNKNVNYPMDTIDRKIVQEDSHFFVWDAGVE